MVRHDLDIGAIALSVRHYLWPEKSNLGVPVTKISHISRRSISVLVGQSRMTLNQNME